MGKSFKCGNKTFSSDGHVLVVAELGTAHEGSFEKATSLIDAAIDCGTDVVKFQTVYADEILHPNTGFVKLPSGNISLYERFQSLEVPIAFFERLKEYCDKKNVGFVSSPFGIRSCDEVANLKPIFIKIASPELNYTQLLKHASEKQLPLVLSSGVSKLADIEKAFETIRSISNVETALLHCVTQYPAKEEEYNVSVLEYLAPIFDTAVGISDHSQDCYLVPLLSVACGACIIEKHFCLSNKDSGLDDKIALNPKDFSKMVKAIREVRGRRKEDIIDKLLTLGFDKNRIKSVLGNGKKILANCEKNNYGRTNRSLHYMGDFEVGYVLKKNDIGILRTEKILSVGESPDTIDYFVGSVLQRSVKSGEGARLFDIIKGNKND